MSKEIPKPEAEENKFDEEDEEEENASDLNKIIEEEMKEKRGEQKEITIDELRGEMLTSKERKERIEKGLER